MHVVEGGQAREILYDSAYFDMPADSPATGCRTIRALPASASRAAATASSTGARTTGWRSSAPPISGRSASSTSMASRRGGVAVDTAVFGRPRSSRPSRTSISRPRRPAPTRSRSMPCSTGRASRARSVSSCARGTAVVMDVEKALYLAPRRRRLGIAPLTSMYWFSENREADGDRLAARDPRFRRPRAVDRGRRAHLAPAQQSAADHGLGFADERPRGFGLLQRDRSFDHYLDGVYYDRRPSLWIEPLGDWGRGAVQLVEIPTDDEIHDNIVAMWVRPSPPAPGRSTSLPLPHALGGGRALSVAARPLRRDPPRQRRPGRHGAPEGRAQVHGRVQGRAADAPRQGTSRAGSVGLAGRSRTSAPRPCRTTCPAIGGPSSTSRR